MLEIILTDWKYIHCMMIMTSRTGNRTRCWVWLQNHMAIDADIAMEIACVLKCWHLPVTRQCYYLRPAKINCHYLITLLCSMQFNFASVLGRIQTFWPWKGRVLTWAFRPERVGVPAYPFGRNPSISLLVSLLVFFLALSYQQFISLHCFLPFSVYIHTSIVSFLWLSLVCYSLLAPFWCPHSLLCLSVLHL